MPLSYYLLKPVKRVTDYPTFVEKLLKNTPSSHPDWGQLNEALTRAKSLCDQVTEMKHFFSSVKLQFGKFLRNWSDQVKQYFCLFRWVALF
jgi:hypothetical protein